MNISQKKQKKAGFTLIELLVVISIIAFISAVVLVGIDSSRNKAKISAVVQNMTAVKSDFEIHVLENNRQYASAAFSGSCSAFLPGGARESETVLGNTSFTAGEAIYATVNVLALDVSDADECFIDVDTSTWAVSFDGGNILDVNENFCISYATTPNVYTGPNAGSVATGQCANSS